MSDELRQAWNEYCKYLMEKYPPQDGEPWSFTCEHHRKIDAIINCGHQSDDPMVWLVEEFGALKNEINGMRIAVIEGERLRIAFNRSMWIVNGVMTRQPLTRDDVRRLCEIFGVKVKK